MDRFAACLEIAGLAAAVAGFWFIYPPAGLIALGAALFFVGLLLER